MSEDEGAKIRREQKPSMDESKGYTLREPGLAILRI